MNSAAIARAMREVKQECEKLAEEREQETRQKCAQILLAGAALHMLREKVAKCRVGESHV